MLELTGKTITKTVPVETGKSLLDLALKHGVDFGFSCVRGTCGRCRCSVETGLEALNRVTDEEWEKLEDQELDQGYRLACQATIRSEGTIKAVYETNY